MWDIKLTTVLSLNVTYLTGEKIFLFKPKSYTRTTSKTNIDRHALILAVYALNTLAL